jgi:cysteinyl-tRNA synthetase
MFKTFNEVLGIIDFTILEEAQIPEEILQKLELRNTAKAEKDFENADRLRDEIQSM